MTSNVIRTSLISTAIVNLISTRIASVLPRNDSETQPVTWVAGQDQEGLRISAKTNSPVTAFLSCASNCPIETLRKLSPVFLSRLYHHLGDGMLPSQVNSKVDISYISGS